MNAPLKRRAVSRDTLAILIALAAGEQTGSRIQQRIIGDTIGVYVSSSSLYTALHRLTYQGLVESHHKRFSLTDAGWRYLRLEVGTLEAMVEKAKRRLSTAGSR